MYIKFMIKENKDLYISYWLLLITFLVALMIIVGGLTRLTDSGLSITKWNLISGIVPPLSLADWEKSFSLYKKIPEYKLVNSTMTLDEFKIIFWWEYFHRLLGRFIGILYAVPLFYFTFKKLIIKKSLFSLYLILLLICFQGFIGWYMVKSGLTDKTDVSHYRLALHLFFAFIIFILLLWNYLKLRQKQNSINKKRLPTYLLAFFISCLLFQICIGAFVSGLDAGQIYQSWPLMNQNYFPDDSNYKDLLSIRAFEVPSLVQFIHRNIAYFIIVLFTYILILVFKNNDLNYLRKIVIYVFITIFLQILLGIFTILSGTQLIYASIHQIGSILLITASVVLVYKNSKIN